MNFPTITPHEFIAKWRASQLKERSAAQEHFIDLCRLLDEPTPAEIDPKGDHYCFERGARKDSGGEGWADVWKRGFFAWEYKGKHANLDIAFDQLRQYALALENPPLLIVSDMHRFRIRTNWTNSVSETHEFGLDELVDSAIRDKLKWAMSDPERLRPSETRQTLTERAAKTFAQLAQSLRNRGHAPKDVAHFVNRLVFCMFAEDVGLLSNNMFTRMLENARDRPEEFAALASTLFRAMSVGGSVGFETVKWFNGGLFENDVALPMDLDLIKIALDASKLDWSNIDPSILGTLFERGLNPDKRSQLGAHYTDRDKIMQIIDPVIIHPLLAEWKTEKARIADNLERARVSEPRVATRYRKQAKNKLNSFLERLRNFTVLDPACGSGNFLYLALHTLHDLEHRVQLEAETLGLQRAFPLVGPANVKGIELNTYAAELARVSVWIGEIQWMRRNGFSGYQEPILGTLETIECRDAILTPEGGEAEWPDADVIIGNPPFLGGKRLITNLGEEYVLTLFDVYEDRVPHQADLVCYWFLKAGEQVGTMKSKRVGLVATNSIRGGANRRALQMATDGRSIFNAWSDEPWVVDGAAVRVSLVCFSREDDNSAIERKLDGEVVDEVYTDLTARRGETGIDLTTAQPLVQNASVAFMGDIKGGPFDIPGDLAREWLQEPANPNGRPNSDVLKPWANGMAITRRPTDKWIIDFGLTMVEEEAALYEIPFQYALKHVRPTWEIQRAKNRRKKWHLHHNPRPNMWRAINVLSRYIATPRVSKHRVFVWLDIRVCPDSALIAIARDDDTTFGILHSRFHEIWSLRTGTWLGKGNDPRYTPTTTFGTFPFPDGLSSDIPASNFRANPHGQAIASAARRLVELRDRWLNPPEWVEWVDQPICGYPKRPVPRDEEAETKLKKRTLTNLYNTQPQWLVNAHVQLDNSVAAAYGWPADISDSEALCELLTLNLSRR
jgi:type II restriction/modification system DNA methylase subunit YeeA